MILHLLRLKIVMLLLSLQTEILFHHLGLLEMLKSCVVRSNTLLIFFVGSPQDDFCPIIFGRPFLVRLIALKKLLVLILVRCLMSLISLNFVDNLMIKNCLVRMKLLVLPLLLFLLLIL